MSGSTVQRRWKEAGEAYGAAAEIAGLKPATISLRLRTLSAFARELEVAPWELTQREYLARLGQLPQSPSRATLRGFYRWAVRAGHVAVDPTAEPSRLPQMTPAPPVWESAISLFEAAHKASGLQPSTVDLRVRLFAVDLTVAPFSMTWENYRNRTSALEVNSVTQQTYRTALRAFYRWAARTRRIDRDPTVEPSLRAEIQRASPAWEAELLPFQRFLCAQGRPEPSIRTTVGNVRRFAREVSAVKPYKVTTDVILEVLASKSSWQTETRRSAANSLRAFYRWAKLVGRCKKNPSKTLPSVKRSTKVVEPATEEAIKEAMAKASPRERLAIRLAAELGLRKAEVAGLHSSDLTGGDGDWSLLIHGKGDKQRRLPVTDGLAHALKARDAGYVFPGNENGHISVQHLGSQVIRDSVELARRLRAHGRLRQSLKGSEGAAAALDLLLAKEAQALSEREQYRLRRKLDGVKLGLSIFLLLLSVGLAVPLTTWVIQTWGSWWLALSAPVTLVVAVVLIAAVGVGFSQVYSDPEEESRRASDDTLTVRAWTS